MRALVIAAIFRLLVLASLSTVSAPRLAASVVVQFLVYADETTRTAFYLGSAEGRTDCIKNPYGTQFQCSLDFNKDNNGVPTVTFPPGKFNSLIPGDFLLTESDSTDNSSGPSDVIRFATNSLQFYSDPDPCDPNDTTSLPTTTADKNHTAQEMDLSGLQVALSNDSQHDLNLGAFLKGKVGSFYSAGKGDIGFTAEAPKGVGYVFVSENMAATPQVLAPCGCCVDVPEPRMIVPLGCGIVLLLAVSFLSKLTRPRGRLSEVFHRQNVVAGLVKQFHKEAIGH